MWALVTWTVLSVLCFYGVALYVLKYCILRRPQPKSKLVHLTPPQTKGTPATPATTQTNETEDSTIWCIIGSGFSGLTMAATLKQNNVPFVVLERFDKIGGNWSQGAYSGVHTISSKRITEISDFPMPDDYPDFPSAEQMLRYLNDYARHFQLFDHLEFGVEVDRADPILDGYQWEVLTRKVDDSTKTVVRRRFKGVIACTGHDWDCNIPVYPGRGTVESLHSRHYKDSDVLKGKRVLTVGAGNSGADIACDAARVGKKSVISVRRGHWFVPRMIFGKPTFECLPFWLPAIVHEWIIRVGFYCTHGKLSDYGLAEPTYRIFDHPLTITDQIFHDIRKGRLHVYPAVESIEGNLVTFSNGVQEEFDMIVYATGYHTSFPALEHLLEFKNGVVQLVHGVVHPRLKNCHLLGVGFVRSGAGPLLHAAATTIERSIRIQDQITFPLGRILLRTGSRCPQKAPASKDIVLDPFKSFAKEFLGRYLLRTVPFWERMFFNPAKYDPERTRQLAYSHSSKSGS